MYSVEELHKIGHTFFVVSTNVDEFNLVSMNVNHLSMCWQNRSQEVEKRIMMYKIDH